MRVMQRITGGRESAWSSSISLMNQASVARALNGAGLQAALWGRSAKAADRPKTAQRVGRNMIL